ncbi:MAG: hypothetical protein GZ086_10270 [Gelidibacter sp.]|nr:hypothetical protein [Gelidibacter sp.]
MVCEGLWPALKTDSIDLQKCNFPPKLPFLFAYPCILPLEFGINKNESASINIWQAQGFSLPFRKNYFGQTSTFNQELFFYKEVCFSGKFLRKINLYWKIKVE